MSQFEVARWGQGSCYPSLQTAATTHSHARREGAGHSMFGQASAIVQTMIISSDSSPLDLSTSTQHPSWYLSFTNTHTYFSF